MRLVAVCSGLCLLILAGCGGGKHRLEVNVSDVALADVKIHRYDIDLFNVNRGQLQQGLEALRPAYRFFLETDLSDPGKLSEMQSYLDSPRNAGFFAAVDSQYNRVQGIEKDLTLAMKHYLYYYPGAKVPRVYAYISGGEYNYPVQFADSVLLIGFDNYLGKDFKPYVSDGLPAYRINRMTADHVVPDCMKVLGRINYPQQFPGNNLLEQMVEAGKYLLFVDAMMPDAANNLKIGYSAKQHDWIVKNEAHVWAAIIENRMLFTTDGKLIRTFMADGPFTAEFSKDAPSRLGEWFGWQIVKNYYEKQSGVTLQELMNEKDAQKILSGSGYKPEK